MKKIFSSLLLILLGTQSCVYHTLPGPANCLVNPVAIEVVAVEDSECPLQVGKITLNASGGEEPYMYSLNDGVPQVNPVFEGLGAGLYNAAVLDKNGCSSSVEVTVLNSGGLNIGFAAAPAGCFSNHGSITVTPTAGTPPYDFKINEGTFQADNTFSNLTKGHYTVTVRDATACEVSQNVRIPSGISFSGEVERIIETKCAIAGCHNGSQFPDFRQFANIKDNAANIKSQVVSRAMPQEGSLTQSEIDAIVCWVDDGAPAN